jgi:putative tricarboxylic transport membrane protein
MVTVKSPKNFWAGLMFIAVGLFFAIGARNYDLGSAARMGPAYFPTMVGALLAVIGGAVVVQSLVIRGEKVQALPLRLILYMTAALFSFGYLLKPLGLVGALTLLVFVSAFAGHEFRLREAVVLAVALTILSVLVFVKGLGQPFPLWPAFLD